MGSDLDRERLLSIAAAARYCGVHRNTIDRWTRDGRLTASRTAGGHRRYRRADLRALLARMDGRASGEG